MLKSTYFPPLLDVSVKIGKNRVYHYARPPNQVESMLINWSKGNYKGEIFRDESGFQCLLVQKNSTPGDFEYILRTSDEDPHKNRWLLPKYPSTNLESTDWSALSVRSNQIRESWKTSVTFAEQNEIDGLIVSNGLRSPQIGALHSVLGHWRQSEDVATVVMPTGTGKTETMLSLLTSAPVDRLLVTVPTDALRDQIAEKFLTLGILKPCGFLNANAQTPIVGVLRSSLKNSREARHIISSSNVIVTTVSALSHTPQMVLDEMASMLSHLFIDEAHHVRANGWFRLRELFREKRIVQFTATPFRRDGKLVDGKVVFNYSLRRAQEAGYFRKISFVDAREYREELSDRAIAEKAVTALKNDLNAGFDHIVLARTNTIDRATEVLPVYHDIASQFSPLLIHSRLTAGERQEILMKLRQRQCRIVVCVDMFGEGFDLPNLKIAAIHDPHKSLAATLQFVGRFVRSTDRVGESTVVANGALAEVSENIKQLYRDDPDWNEIVSKLSSQATEREIKREEFFRDFQDQTDKVSLQVISPKMSTVVYRTDCKNWSPHSMESFLEDDESDHFFLVNKNSTLAVFGKRVREPSSWGAGASLFDTSWHLYLAYWNRSLNLLFINPSHDKGLQKELAEELAGSNVRLLAGETVFHALHGLSQVRLMNLGLRETIRRRITFTMHVGPDVLNELTSSQTVNRNISNFFGTGFDGRGRASVGCSVKGRIWSYRSANDLLEWIEWCDENGAKLANPQIQVPDLIKNILSPEQIKARPKAYPISIDWPVEVLEKPENSIVISFQNIRLPFYDLGIELIDPSAVGELKFRVFFENTSWNYSIQFSNEVAEFICEQNLEPMVRISRNRLIPLSSWFQIDSPPIRFDDSSELSGTTLLRPNQVYVAPFDRDRIIAWDWAGVDISCESQFDGQTKREDSIQARVLREIQLEGWNRKYAVIFDDDGSYEAADIVAIGFNETAIYLDLFHCKFSSSAVAGSRVEDFYELCGQAQKNIHWFHDPERLVKRLVSREKLRRQKAKPSRFEMGGENELRMLGERFRQMNVERSVYIVQPGLSLKSISQPILNLLSSTETHLAQTYGIKFNVIASA